MKSHEDRTRDLFSCFAGQYMLIHLQAAAIPQPGKHGHVGPALRRHNLQVERAKKFFFKYTIPLSEFAMPAGIRQHGGFIALVMVGQSSRHCLKEFKDNSGGFDSRERKLLIGQDQMKEGVAIELLQPRLFAPGHQQPPSPGCLCIFGGKVTLADLPAGMDGDILHRTNKLQLVRESRKRKSKKKK